MARFRGVRPKGPGIEIRYQTGGERRSVYLDTPPKDYVGWNNDPDNPDFLARRKTSMRVMDAALATPSEEK